jgi:hypothetical protein
MRQDFKTLEPLLFVHRAVGTNNFLRQRGLRGLTALGNQIRYSKGALVTPHAS